MKKKLCAIYWKQYKRLGIIMCSNTCVKNKDNTGVKRFLVMIRNDNISFYQNIQKN